MKNNVSSIVTKEGLARIEANKKKERYAIVGPNNRDWVNVTYENKDLAKGLGCKWCPNEKRWYATGYMSAVAVESWIAEYENKKAKRAK